MEDIKQVIVVRKDLQMRKGKMCAMSSHASMKVIVDLMEEVSTVHPIGKSVPTCTRSLSLSRTDPLHLWLEGSFAKVVVYVQSEEELNALEQKANELGIRNAMIVDSGRTEFHGVPTKTCIAIGPDFTSRVDEVTGNLKLL